MSLEGALIAQARPFMLAQKARELLRLEIAKGCQPDIARQTAALEPAYQPLMFTRERFMAGDGPAYVPEAAPAAHELIRLRVWIPPDQKCDWRASELFIRQMRSITCRAGLEICGNERVIHITLLCHRSDLELVATAFRGQFCQCELALQEQHALLDLPAAAWEELCLYDYYPPPPYSHLLTRPEELYTSPFGPLVTAMAAVPAEAVAIYQALFQPVHPSHDWHRNVQNLLDWEYTIKLTATPQPPQRYLQEGPSGDRHHMAGQVETKAHNDRPFYALALRMAVVGAGSRGPQFLRCIGAICNLFQHGGRPLNYLTEADYAANLPSDELREMFLRGLTYRPGFIVNSLELTGPVHVPPAQIVEDRAAPVEMLETLPLRDAELTTGTRIGFCEYAGRLEPVCIPLALRGQHARVIGRPRQGKSSMMEYMILDDLEKGAGVAVIDPHGDLVERILHLLPERDIARTIYLDPGDSNWVPIWNPLQRISGQDLGRTADDLVGAFKSFVTGWGDRLEHLLRHTFYGLLHLPGSTLLDASNLLRNQSEESEHIRKQILQVVDNPVARPFWLHDLQKYGKDDLGPPKNKLSKLLVSDTVSLMLSQPDSAFHLRQVIDDGMILLVNLSHVGSEVREILGCLLLSLLHQTALSRSDTPISARRAYHVYCDEAHRFMTDSLEDLITETGKFGVSLTLAHQFMGQFSRHKLGALSSVGSTISFSVNTDDARDLIPSLRGLVDVDDLINLKVGQAIARIGREIVRIQTPLPREKPCPSRRDEIIAESHRRYYKPASEVRQMLRRRRERWAADRTGAPLAAGDDPETALELVYDTWS